MCLLTVWLTVPESRYVAQANFWSAVGLAEDFDVYAVSCCKVGDLGESLKVKEAQGRIGGERERGETVCIQCSEQQDSNWMAQKRTTLLASFSRPG